MGLLFYHAAPFPMLPVFIRERASGADAPASSRPADADGAAARVRIALAGDMSGDSLAIGANTEVALREDGPFRRVGDALIALASLRDALADALVVPSLTKYRRVRGWLFVALIPLLMLAELDREIVAVGIDGAWMRLVCDLFLAVVVGADLVRMLPRHPRVSAIVLAGAGARFTLFVAKACGRIHPAIAVAAVGSLGAAVALWRLSPTPAAVAREILARWDAGSANADARSGEGARAGAGARGAAQDARAGWGVALAAAGVGLGLPIALAVAQRSGIGLWPRAVLFAAYAALVPIAFERAIEGGRARSSAPTAIAIAAAFALSLGLTNGAHFGADALIHAAQCMRPSSGAQRLLDAEAHEVTRNLEQARTGLAFFAMNVIVVPLAEERVYRDLAQRVFARRFAAPIAIALASVLFAAAHLDVYRVAVYQMIPLGIACGIAYAEGGLIAAVAVHALWNLHLLL